MKIPIILAQGVPQTGLRSLRPGPGPDYTGVARDLGQAAQTIAEVQRKKQEQAVKLETDGLAVDAEKRLALADIELRRTTTDPDEYTAAYQQLAKNIQDETYTLAKHPESAAFLRKRLPKAFLTRDVDAAKHADSLFVSRGEAQLITTLDDTRQLGGLTGFDANGQQAFVRHYQEGVAAIKSAEPLIGSKRVAEETKKLREDMLTERARRHKDGDPEGFLDNQNAYVGMAPEKLEVFAEAARKQIESERKSRNAEWDAFYKRVEDDWQGERQQRLIGLRDQANKGLLTIADLDRERSYRTFETPAEYDALHKVITEEPREAPSDPATLTFVQLRTRGATPGLTTARLDQIYLAGKLNRKDWLEEKGKLQQRTDYLKTEGRTEKNQAMAQAEQMLKADLDLTAPEDQWDLQDAQLHARALDELTARSFEGTEDPLTVARELGQRYAPIRQGRIKLKVEDYKRTLPVVLQTDNAEKAIKLLDELQKSGAFTGGTIDAYRRTILDWKRQEQVQQNATTPSGGLGRTPGSKPESGK